MNRFNISIEFLNFLLQFYFSKLQQNGWVEVIPVVDFCLQTVF